MTTTLFVKPNGPRPDFRLVISFLWKDMHNVDSDGDSYNPSSRTWTELYLKNRECPSEVVDVAPAQSDPLVLEVRSDIDALASRGAYFLARETSGEVGTTIGDYFPLVELVARLGEEFDLATALRRADLSVWRSATEADPYPNLERVRHRKPN